MDVLVLMNHSRHYDHGQALQPEHQKKLRLENKALQERLAKLEQKFSFMEEMLVVKDQELATLQNFVTGANKSDTHFTGVQVQRDLTIKKFGDLRRILAGDPCPRCDEGKYQIKRGIEVGHIFILGTKYSEAMKAVYLDSNGKENLMGKAMFLNEDGYAYFTQYYAEMFNFESSDKKSIYLYKTEISSTLSKVALKEFASSKVLEEEKLGILAQAASVLHWHSSHQYCSSCGKPTTIKKAGWRRDCSFCGREHFPRVDSVVIMLVTYGDYCLLGRGIHFKEGRYSCLAGYVESGETLEDAALRELYEEAGVFGHEVNYMLSQPWPFPSTLMVGMHVVAKAQELKLDYNELSDAKWVHKKDIKAILEGDESFDFTVPNKIAIARNLLEIWVSK